MTTTRLSSADPSSLDVDALLIGIYRSPSGPVMVDPREDELLPALVLVGATGASGEVITIAAPDRYRTSRIVAVGLGERSELCPNRVREAAGVGARAMAGYAAVGSRLSELDLRAATEGHLLGAYQFTTYRRPEKPAVQEIALCVAQDCELDVEEYRRAVIAAEAVLLARDLVNTAPNDLSPMAFADRVVQLAVPLELTVRVWDEKELRAAGFGGILAVGGGSSRPPRLVEVNYRPAAAQKLVTLVGKGITFDSGGISIKDAANMDHMTSDMAGAAAVVATVLAAARLKLPVNVSAILPLAENLPSGTAYRPGDVITHLGGRTSHIRNTDCEGRLVLADAIVLAARDHPDYLIDVATLTYSQMIGLGPRTMAVMGTESFRDQVARVGREVGEDGWAMPMPEYLRAQLDSPIADIANDAIDRAGGMMIAAHYLREFVPAGLPWVHLDIAGPAYNTAEPYGFNGCGGTGIPVRTLLATLSALAS